MHAGFPMDVPILWASGISVGPVSRSCWREMGSFWAWREVNNVLLYGYILEGLPRYGCVFREFTTS